TSTLTLSLAAASALEPGRKSATALLIPSLSNNQPADPRQLYRFNDLTGISGKRVGDTRETVIPTISTDATIAIDFAQPLANDAAIATPTYDGSTDAGVQRVQDLTVRYALLSIAVRSSPLLGAGAGVWSDLVKESDTRFSLAGGAPQNLTFAWDVDARADGKLAPKRLLLNCESPYSFVGAATRNDEEAFRNDLGYPCCDPVSLQRLAPRPHSLSFSERALWSRAPADGKFSGNGARWHWMQRPTPLIAPGEPSFPGSRVARFSPPAAALVGLVDLPEPAVRAQITVAWDAQAVELFFEGYSGLELAAHQEVILFPAGKIVLVLEVPPTSLGLTRLVLRTQLYTALPAPRPTVPQATADQPSGDGDHLPAPSVAVLDVSYVGLADTLAAAAAAQQCKNGGAPGPPTSDAKGKLAFLPNHDYEVVVTTAIELSTKAQGRRSLELSQAFYFRTAGPPGLNAVPNTGDDLRHHVESTYPPTPALLVYRQEPVALAFTEGMSTVLPIDRAPKPGIVPERAQMLRLQLNVDRIASLDGLQRLTVPSEDWIEVHRPRTSSSKPHTYLAELFTEAKVRRAASLDPLVLRHEAVKAASTACGALQTEHTSQVLLHEPLDADENPGSWEAQTGYRAIVRQKDGPFIARSTFDASALGAFLQKTFPGVAPRQFSVDGAGNLVAPAAGLLPYFAVCGEAGWDHLQVQTRIDLRGARFAGIAIGVGVAAAGVVRGIVAAVVADGSGGQLILRSLLYPNTDVVIGRAALTVSGPVTLTVIAFDDKVRATVGDVTVEAQRPVREGQVALVAAGPAAFAGFRVDALDMFTFDFKTSRYLSFAEHIGSYDGHLGVLASGAFGGSPATIAGVLAAHGGEIAPLMSAAADPQERQKLFAKIVGTLGIGLRKAPISLALARLIDASGTYGFLLESCEPIALTREVTVQLVEHGLRFVQDRSGPFGGLGGHFEPFEEPVPLTPLTNGDETAALLLSRNGAPMESGFYRLKFVLDRRRWRASDTTDPEHVYHQEQSIELTVLPADPPSP
ncbi:MAG TPA: hypothetical protein VH988_02810, partial [Thermoanaerobaculia bacterium]|nr:hypothetical protein [Thermoanaerobaculia bacterium]